MLRFWQFRFYLLIGLCVIVYCTFCGAEGKALKPLVSMPLLDAAGLEQVWKNDLPIKENEYIQQVRLADNHIYILTNLNYMISLNRQKGTITFARPFAAPGLSIYGPKLYGGELMWIIGNELVQIDPEFGTELSSKRINFRVVCPPACNKRFFYVSGGDNRLHAILEGNKTELFNVAAPSQTLINSVLADESFAVFSTEKGEVLSIPAGKRAKRWQFNAGAKVVAPLIRDGENLFFASEDTNIYRLNINNGQLLWKHQTGAILERSPRITQTAVYQYVRYKGLVALDKLSSREKWHLEKGVELLAEGAGKAYVITKDGKLAVVDNYTNKLLFSMNLASVEKYASNVKDSKIYIADYSGRIVCLKPAD